MTEAAFFAFENESQKIMSAISEVEVKYFLDQTHHILR